MGPKRNCHTRRRGPSVWSAPIISVDSIAITPMASATGSHTLSQYANPRLLLDMVVGRLPGNDYVVHVALAQSGAGDANEVCILLQLANRPAAHVTHARSQPAHQLENHAFERPAIGHAPLDPFRHILRQPVLVGAFALHNALGALLLACHVAARLEVALARTLAHGRERSHAAIALEAAPLEQDGFAGALVDASKER